MRVEDGWLRMEDGGWMIDGGAVRDVARCERPQVGISQADDDEFCILI